MPRNMDKHTLSDHEMGAMRKAIEDHLDILLPEPVGSDVVSAAMREGVLAPGKRIRPLLMLLVARDLGYRTTPQTLLDLAAAIEMTHAASLMLDDIPCMDNAEMRRGLPTIHKTYGESVAILAAVGLLSKAFGLISALSELSGECRSQAVTELSAAIGVQGLVQGQFQDLSEGFDARSTDAILNTNHLKTGILFSAMLQIIAIVAEATQTTQKKLRAFALDFGQAFQLLDDLSDRYPFTGKDRNKDADKSTLVNVIGNSAVYKKMQEHIHSAEKNLALACLKGNATRDFMLGWFASKSAFDSPIMKSA